MFQHCTISCLSGSGIAATNYEGYDQQRRDTNTLPHPREEQLTHLADGCGLGLVLAPSLDASMGPCTAGSGSYAAEVGWEAARALDEGGPCVFIDDAIVCALYKRRMDTASQESRESRTR